MDEANGSIQALDDCKYDQSYWKVLKMLSFLIKSIGKWKTMLRDYLVWIALRQLTINGHF